VVGADRKRHERPVRQRHTRSRARRLAPAVCRVFLVLPEPPPAAAGVVSAHRDCSALKQLPVEAEDPRIQARLRVSADEPVKDYFWPPSVPPTPSRGRPSQKERSME
jgi:hypothetical protein